MSYQASAYAARVCESVKLTLSARLVLYVMAETANGKTRIAYGGKTVALRTGLHSGSVRRAVGELVTAGVIGVASARPGRATVYVFPVGSPLAAVAELSTTRAGERGSGPNPVSTPAPGSALPAPGSAPPAPGGARTCLCTGACTCARRTTCADDCPLCEGMQYLSTPGAPHATRCRGRARIDEAVS